MKKQNQDKQKSAKKPDNSLSEQKKVSDFNLDKNESCTVKKEHSEQNELIKLKKFLEERDIVIDNMKVELEKFKSNEKFLELSHKIQVLEQKNDELNEVCQYNLKEVEQWKQKNSILKMKILEKEQQKTPSKHEQQYQNLILQLENEIFEKSDLEQKIAQLQKDYEKLLQECQDSKLKSNQPILLRTLDSNFSFGKLNKEEEFDIKLQLEQSKDRNDHLTTKCKELFDLNVEQQKQIFELQEKIELFHDGMENIDDIDAPLLQTGSASKIQSEQSLPYSKTNINQLEKKLKAKNVQIDLKIANYQVEKVQNKINNEELMRILNEFCFDINTMFDLFDYVSNKKYYKQEKAMEKKICEQNNIRNRIQNSFQQILKLQTKNIEGYEAVTYDELKKWQLGEITQKIYQENERNVEINKGKKEIQSLNHKIQEQKNEIEMLLKEIDRINRIQIAQQQLQKDEDTQKIIQQYEKKISELLQNIENKDHNISLQDKQLHSLGNQIIQLNNQIDQQKQKIDQHFKDMQTIKSDKIVLQSQIVEKQKDVDQFQILKQQLEEVQYEKVQLISSKNELLIKLSESNEKQISMNELLQVREDQLESQIENLNKIILQKESQLKDLDNNHSKITQQLEQNTNVNQAINKQILEKDNEIKKLEQVIQKIKQGHQQEIDNIDNQVSNLIQKHKDVLKQHQNQFHLEIYQYKEEIQKLQQEFEKIKQNIFKDSLEFDVERSSFKILISELQQTISTQRFQIDSMTQQMELLKKEYQESSQNRDLIRNQTSQLQALNEQIQDLKILNESQLSKISALKKFQLEQAETIEKMSMEISLTKQNHLKEAQDKFDQKIQIIEQEYRLKTQTLVSKEKEIIKYHLSLNDQLSEISNLKKKYLELCS